MITIKVKGTHKKTELFLEKAQNLDIGRTLTLYGERGVTLLSVATPKRTGKTASSWAYTISKTSIGYKIEWSNTNVNNGVAVALLIQYGHGTGRGGLVQGVDYINPAMAQIFSNFVDDLSEEVRKL